MSSKEKGKFEDMAKLFKWCCILAFVVCNQQPLSKDRSKKTLISDTTVLFLFANKMYFQ